MGVLTPYQPPWEVGWPRANKGLLSLSKDSFSQGY